MGKNGNNSQSVIRVSTETHRLLKIEAAMARLSIGVLVHEMIAARHKGLPVQPAGENHTQNERNKAFLKDTGFSCLLERSIEAIKHIPARLTDGINEPRAVEIKFTRVSTHDYTYGNDFTSALAAVMLQEARFLDELDMDIIRRFDGVPNTVGVFYPGLEPGNELAHAVIDLMKDRKRFTAALLFGLHKGGFRIEYVEEYN